MSATSPVERPARRRVFFALWPDEATRRAIVRATRAAVRRCGGRRTPQENLHVTLAFLGPLAPEDLSRVLAITPPPAAPFELVLDRLGLWDRSQILWLAPTEIPSELIELERRLWDRLVALGFERERRPYLPHVTLARKARAVRGRAAPVDWRVDGIELVESKTGPRSSRYEVLERWDFSAG